MSTPLHVVTGEQLVVFVAQVHAGDERCGDDDGVILPAAVYHVLPHEHAQPVAVIVPAQRLDLYVLAQHVKAHVLGRLNVENERLVARCGVHAVGPIALIEQTVVEIRLSVQKQTLYALVVLFHGELAHGKVAFDPVLTVDDRKVVKLRVLRRPCLKVGYGDFRRQGIALSAKLGVGGVSADGLGGDFDKAFIKIRRYL